MNNTGTGTPRKGLRTKLTVAAIAALGLVGGVAGTASAREVGPTSFVGPDCVDSGGGWGTWSFGGCDVVDDQSDGFAVK